MSYAAAAAAAAAERTPLTAPLYFDDNSPPYRHCCCHVRVWATIIGILEVLSLTGDLASTIVFFIQGRNRIFIDSGFPPIADFLVGLFAVVFGLVVIGLMFYGIQKYKHQFLIPHIVLQVIGCVLVVAAAIYGFNLATLYPRFVAYGIGLGVGLLLGLAIQIYFLYGVIRCYRYLKAKDIARTTATYGPMTKGYASM